MGRFVFARPRAHAVAAALPGCTGYSTPGGTPFPPEKQDFRYVWLHNWPQRGVLASAFGHNKTLQCPRNKKMSGRFCTRTLQRHMRLSKKCFLSKNGPRGHHFAGSGLEAKNSPKSWKISVVGTPPGTAEAVFSGGGANVAAAATKRARIVGRVVPYGRRRSN